MATVSDAVPATPASWTGGGATRGWALVVLAIALLGVLAAWQPALLQGVVGGGLLGAAICFAVFLCARARPETRVLRRVIGWGIALRAFFAVVHLVVALWFYGGMTDLGTYLYVVDQMYDRLANWQSPLAALKEGYQTIGNGCVIVFLTMVSLVTGPTLWSFFIVSAAISLAGAYLYVRAFQRAFPDAEGERFFVYVMFFMPAVCFWSVYAGKDFLAFFLMGWTTYATAGLLKRFNAADALGLALSTAALTLLRAHIAIPVVLAIALCFVFHTLRDPKVPFVVKPLLLAVIGYVAIKAIGIGIAEMGFKEFSVEALAEQAEFVQRGFAGTTSARTSLPLAIAEPTPAGVLKFLPIGIFTLLFRPSLSEAHNALALASASENLLLLGMVVWRARRLGRSVVAVFRQPFLLYCVIALFATAAVLSISWNLGTMARHKTMVMPFVMMLLAGTRPRSAPVSEEANAHEAGS
jgi:hypothetical protein